MGPMDEDSLIYENRKKYKIRRPIKTRIKSISEIAKKRDILKFKTIARKESNFNVIEEVENDLDSEENSHESTIFEIDPVVVSPHYSERQLKLFKMDYSYEFSDYVSNYDDGMIPEDKLSLIVAYKKAISDVLNHFIVNLRLADYAALIEKYK